MTPGPDSQDPAAQEPRGKVLYIEDDDAALSLVELLLHQSFPGVELIKARTGAEGVRLTLSESPDWVLLDMHLPDMTGLNVVRALNETIATRKLRVTILTADDLTMDVLKAMSLGAYEYWVKPIDIDVVEAGVRRALAPSRKADPTRR
jgi:two-component system, cell cycle response regulator DivK